MALLKKLFNKDSQEVKEFWKAFTALYKKVNQKNLDAFLNAQKACPQIWQGPFLLSIIYEVQNDIPSDPAKARMYRDQALKASQGTEDQEWVELFYGFYDIPAINWVKSDLEYMTEEVHAVRRLGVAAIMSYENRKPVVTAHDEFDDADFWSKIFISCYSENGEYSPFYNTFLDWKSYKGGKASQDDIKYTTNEHIKTCNKQMKNFDKTLSKSKKGKWTEKDEQTYSDMFLFVGGYYRIGEGPYCFDFDDYVRQCGGEVYSGVGCMVSAAGMGSAPAVHYLVWMAHSDDADVRNVVRRGIRSELGADGWMLQLLKCCAKAGDSEALRLIDEYYPGN